MDKVSRLVGRPVVTETGAQIETINDVVFDPQTHHILCFVIAPGGGWFGGAKILPWSDRLSIKPNALVVSSPDQIVPARQIPEIQTMLESNNQLSVGKQLVTPDGRRIGVLSDIFFDKRTGEIRHYEVSRTTPKTAFRQTAILEPDEVHFEQGSDAVVQVAPDTASLIEERIRR